MSWDWLVPKESISWGNIFTLFGVVGTYVALYRAAQRERRAQHQEGLNRMDKLEMCFHRHLGNDTDTPIKDRILIVETLVKPINEWFQNNLERRKR